MKLGTFISAFMATTVCMSSVALAAPTAAFGDSSAGNHPNAPYAASNIIVPRPDKSVYVPLEKYDTPGTTADIKEHWAEKQILYFLKNGYMKTENGKFEPDAPVTYADFAQTVARLDLNPVEFGGGIVSYHIFSDFPLWNPNSLDTKAGYICAEAGVWGNPYEQNNSWTDGCDLNLNDFAQKEAITMFLMNMVEPTSEERISRQKNNTFGDITSYSQDIVTKAEMADMLYRVLEKYRFDMDVISNNLYGNYHAYYWSEEAKLLELVNTDREKNGVAALRYNADLNALCEIKMLEKSIYGYETFGYPVQYKGKSIVAGHLSQFYGNIMEMANTFGLQYRSIGENAAKNITGAEEVHEGFKGSASHKKNYLNTRYKMAGFAVGGKMTYEMFATNMK